jgi:hypothetical protein
VPHPIGKTPVGESPGRRHWRQRYTVATGRWRRFLFGWGAAGSGDGGAALDFDGDGIKICDICNSLIRLSRYIRPYRFSLIS